MDAKFFISYRNISPYDDWASWLAWILEGKYGNGCCHIQDWDFDPAGNFISAMQDGAAQADWTIALIGPDYFDSEYCNMEWTSAFKDRKLIILEVEPGTATEAWGLLSPRVRIQLFDKEEDEVRRLVLEHIAKCLTYTQTRRLEPGRKPAFPVLRSHQSESPPHVDATYFWVPFLNSPWFVPAPGEWAKAKSALKREASGLIAVVLSGMGGVGKTQAAVSLAYEFKTFIPFIHWLQGDSITSIEQQLAEFVSIPLLKCDLSINAPQHERLAYTLAWLERSSDWIIIIDSIDSPEVRDGIKHVFPRGCNGRILITSQLKDWTAEFSVIRVLSWNEKTCLTFLRKRLVYRFERSEASDLASVLGGLPLCLEQAAAFILKRDISIADFLDAFYPRWAAKNCAGNPIKQGLNGYRWISRWWLQSHLQ